MQCGANVRGSQNKEVCKDDNTVTYSIEIILLIRIIRRCTWPRIKQANMFPKVWGSCPPKVGDRSSSPSSPNVFGEWVEFPEFPKSILENVLGDFGKHLGNRLTLN